MTIKQNLERAKQVCTEPYTANWIIMKDLIEHLFPELRESEDEKIRKELVKLLNDLWAEKQGLMTERKDYERYIAWLENQGEIHEATVLENYDGALIEEIYLDKFKKGDKVIVQIRKA